jgi:hypothetical protein
MKVKTMRGMTLDMGALVSKNGKKVALGNANMNARGDLINRRGEVVKRREVLTQEYNAANPKAVRQVALRDLKSEVFVSPAEAIQELTKKPAVAETPAAARKPTRKIEDREE